MSEDISLQSPTKTAQAGHRWLDIIKRILVGVVLVLAVVGLIVDASGLVGVWAAYGPARDSVITVSNALTQALQVADKGLTRANGYVQTGRQTLTQVNTEAVQLGDRAKTNSPLITALVNVSIPNSPRCLHDANDRCHENSRRNVESERCLGRPQPFPGSHDANAESSTECGVRSRTRGGVGNAGLACHAGKRQSRCCDQSGNGGHEDNGQDRRTTGADSIACHHLSSEGG